MTGCARAAYASVTVTRFPMRLVLLASSLLALAACGSAATGPDLVPVSPDVRTAPGTVTLATRAVTLASVSAWRDFMPAAPPQGRALLVSLQIVAADGGPLPTGLAASEVHVVRGTMGWRTAPAEQRPWNDGRALELVLRDGPLWNPGEVVDVVVTLRDAQGARALVRASGVVITRTD